MPHLKTDNKSMRNISFSLITCPYIFHVWCMYTLCSWVQILLASSIHWEPCLCPRCPSERTGPWDRGAAGWYIGHTYTCFFFFSLMIIKCLKTAVLISRHSQNLSGNGPGEIPEFLRHFAYISAWIVNYSNRYILELAKPFWLKMVPPLKWENW